MPWLVKLNARTVSPVPSGAYPCSTGERPLPLVISVMQASPRRHVEGKPCMAFSTWLGQAQKFFLATCPLLAMIILARCVMTRLWWNIEAAGWIPAALGAPIGTRVVIP